MYFDCLVHQYSNGLFNEGKEIYLKIVIRCARSEFNKINKKSGRKRRRRSIKKNNNKKVAIVPNRICVEVVQSKKHKKNFISNGN